MQSARIGNVKCIVSERIQRQRQRNLTANIQFFTYRQFVEMVVEELNFRSGSLLLNFVNYFAMQLNVSSHQLICKMCLQVQRALSSYILIKSVKYYFCICQPFLGFCQCFKAFLIIIIVFFWLLWLAFKTSFSSWGFQGCLSMFPVVSGPSRSIPPLNGQARGFGCSAPSSQSHSALFSAAQACITFCLFYSCIVLSGCLQFLYNFSPPNPALEKIFIYFFYWYLLVVMNITSIKILLSVSLVPAFSLVMGGKVAELQAVSSVFHHGARVTGQVYFPWTPNLHLQKTLLMIEYLFSFQ